MTSLAPTTSGSASGSVVTLSTQESSAGSDGRILELNLKALTRSSPHTARLVAEARASASLRWLATETAGEWAAEVETGGARRALCSRRRPRDEARRMVETIDIAEAAVFIVSGFGCGYHVEALARRLNRTGVVVVFEPDVSLLRAVLERVDCSAWLGSLNVAVMTEANDTGEMARLVDGIEGLVAMGVTLVEHPASRERLGEKTKLLHERFLGVVKAVKMTVITTMMQVKTTLANLTKNLDAYVSSPGVAELAGVCAGRAAIVVSAGPSLKRNIALLEDPEVRERFVIVAVQTVLKPLLKRGIQPHFVTALDYSAISTRFYEGLTAADVEGVMLVVDPKVNPAVLNAWPGEKSKTVRVQADKHLDKLLGADLIRDKGTLPAGATVAHLAYYLARHLGCDPVALIGQDLGFTDGQYYSAGAAIHNLWACELNEFNTLEMLEWQRILRMGTHLRRTEDTLGRPVYTDEQMATYLVQFERDFKADAERGLTTVDATEGGVRKQHTAVRTLGEFIAAERGRGCAGSPSIGDLLAKVKGRKTPPPSLRAVQARVERVRNDAKTIAEVSRQAAVKIAETLEHQADRERVDGLIGELERLGSKVAGLQPAFDLTQTMNQTGVFNRLRADRALQVETNQGTLSAVERQKRQLERDAENVRTLADAAGDLAELLAAMGEGEAEESRSREVSKTAAGAAVAVSVASSLKMAAIVPVYADQAHLGQRLGNGRTVLGQTVQQLLRSARLNGQRVVMAAENGAKAREWLGEEAGLVGQRVEIVEMPRVNAARRSAVRAARLLARECWRGGLGNQSVYDEVFDAAALRALVVAEDVEAVLLVGGDWCAVDPELCDQVIARHAENPGHSRFTFTQAPPGLCGCVLSRSLLEDFAAGVEQSGVFASIGGLLGYIPFTPIVDLINLPECVTIDPGLRDLWGGERFIADSPRGRMAVERKLACDVGGMPEPCATHGVVEIADVDAGGAMRYMPREVAARVIEGFARELGGEPGVVTLRSADALSAADPVGHPEFATIVGAARGAGLNVHVRTPLTSSAFDGESLMDGRVAIISVDLLAESEGGYAAVTGRDARGWTTTRNRMHALMGERGNAWAIPWIVPRVTRCDAAYGEIDGFYRMRVIQCGAAVLDALPRARAGERIEPLPMPETARRRLAARTRVIGVDGQERKAL